MFEHKTVLVVFENDDELEKQLDARSDAGWELVAVLSFQEASGSPNLTQSYGSMTALFKRRKSGVARC